MKRPIWYYISELLFLHECVIVPEFGGFISNRKPAQLNKTTGSLTPPSTKILFNKNLKTNDGLLIAHIANREKITQKLAKESIMVFVENSNKNLSNTKILRIEKIGLFTIGDQGNIIYTQDISINYNLDSFGLKPTYNQSIKRTEISDTKVNNTIHSIKSKSMRPKVFLRAAAVLIPLITLSFFTISEEENISNVYKQMATLTPFATNKNIDNGLMPNIKETLEIKPSFNESSTILTQKKYYLIAGAFAEEKNAKRLLKKLNSWNYNALILKENNLLRVSYNSFKSRKEAVLALKEIKKKNPEAWLLTK